MRNYGQCVLNTLPNFLFIFFTIHIMPVCKSDSVSSESTTRGDSQLKGPSPTGTEENHEKPQYVQSGSQMSLLAPLKYQDRWLRNTKLCCFRQDADSLLSVRSFALSASNELQKQGNGYRIEPANRGLAFLFPRGLTRTCCTDMHSSAFI